MDVTDSDHKPVRCMFNVDIARFDESIRRQEFGEIILKNEEVRKLFEELRIVPETTVSADSIVLQNQETTILRITNKNGKEKSMFEITCEGQSIKDASAPEQYRARGAFGFPRWLEVTSLPIPLNAFGSHALLMQFLCVTFGNHFLFSG